MRLAPILIALVATACHTAGAVPPVNPCQCVEPPAVAVATAEPPSPTSPEVLQPPIVAPAPVVSRFDQGDAVEIRFHGTWYAAHVLSVVGADRWEVAYDAYDSDWNLIVGPDRIRERQEQAQSPRTQAGRAVRSVGELQVGMTVFVLYGSTWYPSLVRAIAQDGQVRISYVGYGEQWDETVSLERLRMPA